MRCFESVGVLSGIVLPFGRLSVPTASVPVVPGNSLFCKVMVERRIGSPGQERSKSLKVS
jgi:hypothetical protein